MTVEVSEIRSQRSEVRFQGTERTSHPAHKLRWKGLSLSAKWIGALLLLLSSLGAFKHHDRVKLYKQLQEVKEVSADSETTTQLMKDFGFPDQQIKFIDRLSLHDLRFSPMGRSIAGNVEAKASDGRKRVIADLIEFRAWAYSELGLYRWLSLALIVFGLIIDSRLFFEERQLSVLF